MNSGHVLIECTFRESAHLREVVKVGLRELGEPVDRRCETVPDVPVVAHVYEERRLITSYIRDEVLDYRGE